MQDQSFAGIIWIVTEKFLNIFAKISFAVRHSRFPKFAWHWKARLGNCTSCTQKYGVCKKTFVRFKTQNSWVYKDSACFYCDPINLDQLQEKSNAGHLYQKQTSPWRPKFAQAYKIFRLDRSHCEMKKRSLVSVYYRKVYKGSVSVDDCCAHEYADLEESNRCSRGEAQLMSKTGGEDEPNSADDVGSKLPLDDARSLLSGLWSNA